MDKEINRKKIELGYNIGALISLIFWIYAFIAKESGFAIMFPGVCVFTYLGVLIRGRINLNSWGNSLSKQKFSLIFGYVSIFIVVLLELLSLFFNLL